MTESDPVVCERRGAAGWVWLNRPDHRNAIDRATREGLRAAFDELGADDDVRVVVLTGKGPAFCAGVDLQDPASPPGGPLDLGTPISDPVERCPKPVLAAVNGAAVGGGFELALAADLRVASEAAFFQLTELRIGSLPGSGGTQRLFGALPQAVAWRVLLTGRRVEADEALRYGLASDLFAADGFEKAVEELVNEIARAAPLSLRAAKLAARAGHSDQFTPGLTLERVLWRMLARTEDRQEGRAAFREKRDPTFRGC